MTQEELEEVASEILNIPVSEVRRCNFKEKVMPQEFTVFRQLSECDEEGRDGYGWTYMTGQDLIEALRRLDQKGDLSPQISNLQLITNKIQKTWA